MCLRKSGVENSRGQKRTEVYTQLVADGGVSDVKEIQQQVLRDLVKYYMEQDT